MTNHHFEQLTLEICDGIATITLHGDSTLNALSRTMLGSIRSAFERVLSDESIRCSIITGEGHIFSAGANLRELQQVPASSARDFAVYGQETFGLLDRLSTPIIAQLNGSALGGGLELALGATFRVAVRHAVLGLPELGLGLIPGFGGTQRLARLVGVQTATRLILTSKRLSATEALEINLVDAVVDDSVRLAEATNELANTLAAQPRPALIAAKKAITDGFSTDLALGMQMEADLFASIFGLPHKSEGIRAFLEKRRPVFEDQSQ